MENRVKEQQLVLFADRIKLGEFGDFEIIFANGFE